LLGARETSVSNALEIAICVRHSQICRYADALPF
jgi:hypothetical protein